MMDLHKMSGSWSEIDEIETITLLTLGICGCFE